MLGFHRTAALLVVTLGLLEVQGQFPPPASPYQPPQNPAGPASGPGGLTPNINQLLGGRQRLADACTYLRTRTSIWGSNNAPFKLDTDGFYNDIRRGYPIEVAIKPWSTYQPDNFTDFIIYATSTANPGFQYEIFPGQGGMTQHQFLGVFKVIPQYAAGGKGFMCDPQAMGPDSVGSGEERRILINRALKPTNTFWATRQSAIRQYAGFLWYPTEMAMGVPMIEFTAKLKSDGHWYEIKSRKWKTYTPPDPWQTMSQTFNQYQMMQQNLRALERQANAQAAAPA